MFTFPKFNFAHFRGDLFGGLTAGIVALPLALAFGLQSGLGAAAGLYGAIFISFFAALFGGTETQISGPTAPMTAVSMIIVSGVVAAADGDMQVALPAILLVFLLAGSFQIGLGLLRIGEYIRYIPYPVVSGFMTGIGVIILITQLLPILGYYPSEDPQYVQQFMPQAEQVLLEKILREEAQEGILVLENYQETVARGSQITSAELLREARTIARNSSSGVLGSLRVLNRALAQVNVTALVLALLTIGIIYSFRKISQTIPSTLIALLLVSGGAYLILGEGGYRTISTIPNAFPPFQIAIFQQFSWSAVSPYLLSAISLGALGAIDSLLTSVVADNRTKTKHQPNQELIGQGIGNSIAALFGGLPGAGATIRTVVNIEAGGKTRLSGMIAGVLLLVILLSLGPVASHIPAAVLAGILVTVGIGVMDYKGMRHLRQIPTSEIVVMLVVLGLTVFVDLILAVAMGMILSAVLFMKKIADLGEDRATTAPLPHFEAEIPWKEEGKAIIEKYGNQVYIENLDGPLFFGFAARFQALFTTLPDVEVVIIRLDKVPYVDQSGIYAMEDAIWSLYNKNITVAFVGLHGQPRELFETFDIVPGLVLEELCFADFQEATRWLRTRLEGREE